jgi:1-aminocyclopropane-1-carboxylate deaminase
MKDQIAKLKELKEKVFSVPFENYPQCSRIHKLRNFSFPNTSIYIKRDDELGFGASGSKIRKYLSLIPYLVSQSFHEAIILGGAYSNNILTASQLLTEKGISPILFLSGNKKCKVTGNFLLTSLIVKDPSIHWLDEREYKELHYIINQYIEKKKQNGIKVGVIQEGANMKESLPGSLTLALDIIKNEQENNVYFDHFFIDSGTGFMAISLLLAFSFLNKKSQIHILQVAGDKAEFLTHFKKIKRHFEGILNIELNNDFSFNLYKPTTAKSFGSTNSKIFQTIGNIAHSNGIITDPIYTAKLFLEGQNIIQEKKLTGNILFIHSGGGLSLFGFEEKLQKASISFRRS